MGITSHFSFGLQTVTLDHAAVNLNIRNTDAFETLAKRGCLGRMHIECRADFRGGHGMVRARQQVAQSIKHGSIFGGLLRGAIACGFVRLAECLGRVCDNFGGDVVLGYSSQKFLVRHSSLVSFLVVGHDPFFILRTYYST